MHAQLIREAGLLRGGGKGPTTKEKGTFFNIFLLFVAVEKLK